MVIYYFTFTVVVIVSIIYQYNCLELKVNTRRKQYTVTKFSAFAIIFIPLWLIMGLRHNVGSDYFNYLTISKIVSDGGIRNLNYIEYGYLLLNKITVLLFRSPYSIFLIVALIIVGLYMLVIFERSKSIPLSLLTYLMLGFYFNAMNSQRQFLSIAIVFFSMKYGYENQYIKTIVFIIFASLFHQSALLMIPTYICIWVIKSKYFYLVISIVLMAIKFTMQIWLNILSRSQLISYGNKYVSKNLSGFRVSIPNIAIALGILIMCIFFRKKILNNKQNVFYLRFVWIALLIFILFPDLGAATTRICFYFTSVYILLIPEIMKCFNANIVAFLLSRFLYTLLCYVYMFYILMNSVITMNNFYPYHSIL